MTGFRTRYHQQVRFFSCSWRISDYRIETPEVTFSFGCYHANRSEHRSRKSFINHAFVLSNIYGFSIRSLPIDRRKMRPRSRNANLINFWAFSRRLLPPRIRTTERSSVDIRPVIVLFYWDKLRRIRLVDGACGINFMRITVKVLMKHSTRFIHHSSATFHLVISRYHCRSHFTLQEFVYFTPNRPY